jgi:hypothetical protein
VISSLFELKIHIDRRRIRTLNYMLFDYTFIRIADYQLGYAPHLESLLGMNVSESIYKDIKKFYDKYYENVNL